MGKKKKKEHKIKKIIKDFKTEFIYQDIRMEGKLSSLLIASCCFLIIGIVVLLLI